MRAALRRTAAALPAARAPRSVAVRLAALVLLLFAVHAVPAGVDRPTLAIPLAGADGPAAGLQVTAGLPRGWVQTAPGVAERSEGDGLKRCAVRLRAEAEASARGVRSDAGVLVFRLSALRRTIPVAEQAGSGLRRTWTGDLRGLRVGGPPVAAVARFPSVAASLPPATLVLATVEAIADTSSPVQRTPAYLGRCSRLARREAPGALRAALGGAEVTTARRGAP